MSSKDELDEYYDSVVGDRQPFANKDKLTNRHKKNVIKFTSRQDLISGKGFTKKQITAERNYIKAKTLDGKLDALKKEFNSRNPNFSKAKKRGKEIIDNLFGKVLEVTFYGLQRQEER